MVHPNVKFWRATGTMIGGIVGVGVLGLPYAFSRSGFVVGAIELVVLAVLLTTLQLMFAEITLQTGGSDRVVGYVRRYLGKRAAILCMGLMAVSLWGAMLAYIIVGGQFLQALLSPVLGGPSWAYALTVSFLAILLVRRGLQAVAKIELYVVAILLFLFVFATLAALPHVSWGSVFTAVPRNAFVPYGVVLFALSGLGVVPEMRDVLGKRAKRLLPRAIVLGMTVITVVYLCFTFAVVGATGPATTQNAFLGLVPLLGMAFAVVFALLGFVTIVSIYTVLGLELTNTVAFDARMRWRTAWAFAMFMPPVLYLLGVKEFVTVVGFVGGVLSAGIGVLIVLAFERMRRSPVCRQSKCFAVPTWVSVLLVAVLLAGAAGELFQSGLIRL